MKCVRASSAGFCMGVSLALRKLDEVIDKLESPGQIYIFGSIIHNPQVVAEYAAKGVITASSSEEIPAGATVVVRAHGITKQVRSDLVARGVKVVDATCPKVREACVRIERSTSEGKTLLLFGEESHPEVKCLLSYASGPTFLFDTFDKLREYQLDSGLSYCLAAQTTQDRDTFDAISHYLAENSSADVTVLYTICDATKKRQGEAVKLAEEVEFFIVAGGYNSSNTKRLAEVIAAHGTPAIHVETADELPLEQLRQYKKIGLTAGASTPKKIVDDIQAVLESL